MIRVEFKGFSLTRDELEARYNQWERIRDAFSLLVEYSAKNHDEKLLYMAMYTEADITLKDIGRTLKIMDTEQLHLQL